MHLPGSDEGETSGETSGRGSRMAPMKVGRPVPEDKFKNIEDLYDIRT